MELIDCVWIRISCLECNCVYRQKRDVVPENKTVECPHCHVAGMMWTYMCKGMDDGKPHYAPEIQSHVFGKISEIAVTGTFTGAIHPRYRAFN